jgi:hypothetical protein
MTHVAHWCIDILIRQLMALVILIDTFSESLLTGLLIAIFSFDNCRFSTSRVHRNSTASLDITINYYNCSSVPGHFILADVEDRPFLPQSVSVQQK